MSLEISDKHECDNGMCRDEADTCFCKSCLEEIKQKAYEEGVEDGKRQ